MTADLLVSVFGGCTIKIFFIFICHKYHLQANHISINILMQ